MTARRVGLGLLLVVGLLVAGGIVGGWFWLRRTPGERVVQPPRIDLSGENEPVLELAVRSARDQVLREPRSAEAWGALGKLLLANGFAEDSLPCFAQAARLDRGDARWPYLHGLAQELLDPDAAFEQFREASRRIGVEGPEAAVVRWRFARALIRKGRRDEAKEILLDVLARDPDNPRVLLALGILAHDRAKDDRKELAKAEDYLLRCVKSPLCVQKATVRLAELYQEKGDDASTRRYREQARKLPADPEGPDPIAESYKALLIGRRARLFRAESLLQADRPAEAAELLRLLLDDHPDEAEASVKLGMALLQLGRFPEAEQVLRNPQLHRHGERVQAHYYLSVALLQQGKNADAAKEARLALAGKPDHSLAHLCLGLALVRSNQREEGISELEQAVRFNPESVEPHLELGQTLVAAGRRDEGFRHLDRAVELARDDPRPRAIRERLLRTHPQK